MNRKPTFIRSTGTGNITSARRSAKTHSIVSLSATRPARRNQASRSYEGGRPHPLEFCTTQKSLPCGRLFLSDKKCLLLRGSGGAVRRELLEVVLQQADFNAAAAHALRLLAVLSSLRRGIAHAENVDPVDRNLVVLDQVTNHSIGHLARSRDRGLSVA